MKSLRRAFTLVEIMIVVLIIGILVAIAVPNFVRARESARARACVGNLSQIDSAKEQYAMDNKLAQGSTMPALSALCALQLGRERRQLLTAADERGFRQRPPAVV